MTEPPLLIQVGRALYGPQWQSALARDLGVSDRTVRRWTGGQEHPPNVYAELYRLVVERAKELAPLLQRLKSADAECRHGKPADEGEL